MIKLKELLEAGCHFGHQARRWNPKMEEFIYAKKGGVHIFDLGITAKKLKEALEFVQKLSGEGKKIIFVGTKRQAAEVIREQAEKCGMPYVVVRWLGGIITNWEQIKKSLDKMMDLEEKKSQGEFKKYTKRENVLIDKQIEKLSRFLGGLRTLKENPGAIFIVDVKKEIAAVKEARMKNIPVVALVDTNTDPDLIDYPIPANDDAVSSIKLIVAKIAEAVMAGSVEQKK
ncbi:MAG: 30S ribosomal protein S2 [Patescibacteria group bacterium]|nr:30S ribosomal protein S2 [Patescibacteria group bacterium]